MRVDVDTGYYRSAMDTFYDSNHVLTDAISTMSSALQGCAAMAGHDTGGQAWAASYDSVATDMVKAGADLGGSMGEVANLLNASLVNHEGADHGARVHGPPVGGADTGDPDPSHSTEHLFPAGLPSASGGAGGEPNGWNWLVEHLEGYLWPDADTDKMRSAGSAWQKGSESLTSIAWSVDYARIDLESQRSPEIGAATSACNELRQHCDDLATAYHDVGRACTDYAKQVDEHHDEIIGVCKELLAWTVADQVTGAILSFFTAGAAEVAAQLVEAGIMAKYAARVIGLLRRLVELARAAARVIGSKLAKIGEILAKLKRFLGLKAIRAFEKTGSNALGRWVLAKLPANVRAEIQAAIERAEAGKIRFAKHDGKPYLNSNHELPPGNYTEWTAAANGSPRGAHRVIIEGNPKNPTAIYYWDHVHPPVRIGP